MRAIFLTTLSGGVPVLPPMDAEDGGIQLHEVVEGKVRDGSGYSLIGQAPGPTASVLCLVDTSEATIDAMAADERYALVEVPSA